MQKKKTCFWRQKKKSWIFTDHITLGDLLIHSMFHSLVCKVGPMKVVLEDIEGCHMFNSQDKSSRTDEYWLLLLLFQTKLNTINLGSSLTTADGLLPSQISIIAQIKLYLSTSFMKLLPVSQVVVNFSSHKPIKSLLQTRDI